MSILPQRQFSVTAFLVHRSDFLFVCPVIVENVFNMIQQIWKSNSPPTPNFTISVCCYLLSVACLVTSEFFKVCILHVWSRKSLFHQISGQIVIRQKFPPTCETWTNLLDLQMDSMNVLEHPFDTQPHSLHVFFNLHFLLIKYSEDQS